MGAAFAADAVLVVHLAFILFAALGGLLLFWRLWMALAHLPAAGWAAWIIATHGICPLTPVENALRRAAGQAGYEGSFIGHYLTPLIYPPGLEPWHQTVLAAVLVSANLVLYVWALLRWKARRA